MRKINKPISYDKYPYKLTDKAEIRRKSLDFAIKKYSKEKNISIKESAISKKKKLNVLRIYNKKNKIKCNKITYDMLYLDKKYKFNKTNKIC